MKEHTKQVTKKGNKTTLNETIELDKKYILIK